jgi:hypothetical protein
MSMAEAWCNAHGLDDGQAWPSLLAALRREEDDPESEVCPCDWDVITPNDDGGEPPSSLGVAWPDNSGIFMMGGIGTSLLPTALRHPSGPTGALKGVTHEQAHTGTVALGGGQDARGGAQAGEDQPARDAAP